MRFQSHDHHCWWRSFKLCAPSNHHDLPEFDTYWTYQWLFDCNFATNDYLVVSSTPWHTCSDRPLTNLQVWRWRLLHPKHHNNHYRWWLKLSKHDSCRPNLWLHTDDCDKYGEVRSPFANEDEFDPTIVLATCPLASC
jgi:hypothetical protein